jgi:hypothetical protein
MSEMASRVVLYVQDLADVLHEPSDEFRPLLVAALLEGGVGAWVQLEEYQLTPSAACELASALLRACRAATPIGGAFSVSDEVQR